MNTYAPQQAIHHHVQNVHYHGNVYQNGGDVAITTNAINGGGGPPIGPFAAGGAAGPGTAAGTGAVADPPLLGGDEAGLSTPPRPTRDEIESIIESTVTKAMDRILQRERRLDEDILGLNKGGDLPSIMERQLECLEMLLGQRVSMRA